MVHHRQGLSLRLEAGDDLPRVHPPLDELEGELPLYRLLLHHLIDDPHPAGADLPQDAVRPDAIRNFIARVARLSRIGRAKRDLIVRGRQERQQLLSSVLVGFPQLLEERRPLRRRLLPHDVDKTLGSLSRCCQGSPCSLVAIVERGLAISHQRLVLKRYSLAFEKLLLGLLEKLGVLEELGVLLHQR